MQTNASTASAASAASALPGFSSYLTSSSNSNANAVINNDSTTNLQPANMWKGGKLPPPPTSCDVELVIQPKSIPVGPAKPWNAEGSDDDWSDEDADQLMMEKQIENSDSASDGHDSESECTTEM